MKPRKNRLSAQIEYARILIRQRRNLLFRSNGADPSPVNGDGARAIVLAALIHGEHIGISNDDLDSHGYLAKCSRKSRGMRIMAKIVQTAPATAASCVIAMAYRTESTCSENSQRSLR